MCNGSCIVPLIGLVLSWEDNRGARGMCNGVIGGPGVENKGTRGMCNGAIGGPGVCVMGQ